MVVTLHKWQNECVDLFLKKKKLVVNVTTGAGKTIMAIKSIEKIREENPNYNILIIVPKIIILETLWLRELNKYGFTINQVGVFYGYAHEFSKITLTTTKSVKKLPLEAFDVLIVDECHHMLTPSLMKVLQHKFQYMLGLSASVYNEESKHWAMLKLFDYNIYKYGTKEAIRDGLINTFYFTDIAVKIDEPEIRDKYNDLQKNIKSLLARMGGFERYLKLVASDPNKLALQKLFNDRNELILNYKKKLIVAADIIEKHKNEKILVFNQYNKVSTKLTWQLIDKGIKSHIIDSHVSMENRMNIIKDYERGKFNVLLTSKVFDEGYSLNSIQVIIILSGSSTQRQMIQRIGRVLRKKDTPSNIYQIYVAETFEENSVEKRSEDFREIALEYKLEVV